MSASEMFIYKIFMKAVLMFDNKEFVFIFFENANKQSKKVIKELNNCCLFIYLFPNLFLF